MAPNRNARPMVWRNPDKRIEDFTRAQQDCAVGGYPRGGSAGASALRDSERGGGGGQELLVAAGYSTRTGNFKRGWAKLLRERLLEMTIPDQPRSHGQQYQLSAAGEKMLKTIAQEQRRR